MEDKCRDADRYQQEDAIPWTVLVDDLEGTVHQVYGGLADPTYLIGRDGRVAYYNMWTYAPSLHEAISELAEHGEIGPVRAGVNQMPHMLPAVTTGWRGLRRGLPQSYLEMEMAAPGSGAGVWLGYQLRPLLAPFTQRAKPLPPTVKAGLALGAAAVALLGARALLRRREEA